MKTSHSFCFSLPGTCPPHAEGERRVLRAVGPQLPGRLHGMRGQGTPPGHSFGHLGHLGESFLRLESDGTILLFQYFFGFPRGRKKSRHFMDDHLSPPPGKRSLDRGFL